MAGAPSVIQNLGPRTFILARTVPYTRASRKRKKVGLKVELRFSIRKHTSDWLVTLCLPVVTILGDLIDSII